MVNNLGGTSGMELAISARSALRQLEAEGLSVERSYMGTSPVGVRNAWGIPVSPTRR